jgi:FixJ family two-component response regulator
MTKEQTMIYVIDDDESVRKAFKRLLWSVNFDVETFSSAEEFLKG